MNKFSMRHRKTKKMLGIKGVKGSHIILGLVAIGIIYFVVKKKGGGNGGMPPGMGGLGSHIPGSTTPLPIQDVYGLGQVGTEYLAEKPPLDLYDIYSGTVGDTQYIPTTQELIAHGIGLGPHSEMKFISEPQYERGLTFQPY